MCKNCKKKEFLTCLFRHIAKFRSNNPKNLLHMLSFRAKYADVRKTFKERKNNEKNSFIGNYLLALLCFVY